MSNKSRLANELAASYLSFESRDWKNLKDNLTSNLSIDDIHSIVGNFQEPLSIDEIDNIYLPITRFINLNFGAHFRRNRLITDFLEKTFKAPFIIGISGSVASGKSTISRLLKLLLEKDLKTPFQVKVELVNTDSFLHNLKYLTEHNLLEKKGFPESYDTKAMIDFLTAVKAGRKTRCNVYSHSIYDIVHDEFIEVERPDILIIEGLNCLQNTPLESNIKLNFVDFIDFSIYVDVNDDLLEKWYINRFFGFYNKAKTDSSNYLHKISHLSEQQATEMAIRFWNEINKVNLDKYISSTKVRADLILEKGADHLIERVHLRK